jgi:plastocyanin
MTGLPARRPVALALVVLLVGMAAAPLLSRAMPADARQPETVSINIVDFAFDPVSIEVPVGTTVEWTNQGEAPHTVTADDGAFDSGELGSGDTFSFTFDAAGTFAYHCEIHQRMQASIVVVGADGEDGEGDEATPPPAEETPAAGNLAPDPEPHLAHIHAGECSDLGIVVYSLADIRSYLESPDGTDEAEHLEMIEGTANVALEDLFNEPFSIHVHESTADKQIYIGCVNIPAPPEAPWTPDDGLALELPEQADSHHNGVVTLRPTGDDKTLVTIALFQPAGAPEPETPPPPRGTTYESPTFGYTVTYPRAWEVTEDISANGRDRFVLYNGTSYVTITGADGFNGDPQACLDDFIAVLTSDPNVSNLELATDAQGNPARGGTEATGAFAIYNHDYTFPDRVEAYTLYVYCIPLVEGESVIAVVQNVPTADFNDQVAPREGLLRGLTLPQ